MKKYLVSIVVVVLALSFSMLSGATKDSKSKAPVIEEPEIPEGTYILSQFDEEKPKGYIDRFNAKIEWVQKEAKYGNGCLKVTMGGINEKKTGGLQFYPVKNTNTALEKFTFWLKGDGSDAGIVVLITEKGGESWCWGGKVWDANSLISLSDTEWHKVELNFSEFEISGGDAPQNNVVDIDKIQEIFIGTGKWLENPKEAFASFYIDQVQMEPTVKKGKK